MPDLSNQRSTQVGEPALDIENEVPRDCRQIYDRIVLPVREQLAALSVQADAETNSIDANLDAKTYQTIVNGIYDRAHDRGHFLVDNQVGRLLANVEVFKAVFMTAHGSVYFEDQGGTSLRFKSSELVDHPARRLRDPFDSVYFVNQNTADRLLSTTRIREALAEPIQTFPIAEGLVPIEMNLANADASVDASGLLQIKNLEQMRPSDLHVGHAILAVLHTTEEHHS